MCLNSKQVVRSRRRNAYYIVWNGSCGSHTGVCERNTPPKQKTWGELSFQNTKSGAEGQFLLQDFRAKAGIKEVICSRTPVFRYRA